jgi:HlyD family secretion protein
MSSNLPSASTGDLNEALQIGANHQLRRRLTKVLVGLCVVGAIALAAFFITRKKPAVGPRFETAEVTKGDLHVTITATGTLSAMNSVPVGAEISGRVIKVNVDFNDKVTVGQILAEIDPLQYRAKRDDATAQLNLAKASRLTAQATEREAQLKAERLRSMKESGLTSVQDLEAAEAALARASASLVSSSAQITSAGASLVAADTNLGKTIIRSPINGVVLERSVEPGQTVTSGLQTPVLFTLATDLSEMRLAIKVDEADVGQVKPGQRASFTVDAYPNRVFDSAVVSVKNMPTTAQNVVTYETRLSVKNDDGLLRPGMTATATIVVDDRKDVLLVPNAALRFVPKPKTASAASAKSSGGFSIGSLMPRPPGGKSSTSGKSAGSTRGAKKPAVFVLNGNQPKRIEVEIGATDGVNTSIVGNGIDASTKVIIGEAATTDG